MSTEIPRVSIAGDGNVVGNGNVVVIRKQYFTGRYERLCDAYIEPWPVLERVNLERFVGREWLFGQVDDFVHGNDRGYLVLEGKAGLGKTAFLARLVQQRGYIHHFVELAPGLSGVKACLGNLAVQLALTCRLDPIELSGILSGAAIRPDSLSALLRRASETRKSDEKLILVIDALDEAGAPFGRNVLGLPRVLPQGVYFILSQRPTSVRLRVDTASTPRYRLSIEAGSTHNQTDMRRYLQQASDSPAVARALSEDGITPSRFITALLEKSGGVWVYVHYLVNEIERANRSPLDLTALPEGIGHYYLEYWSRWRSEGQEAWYESYLPLLATLGTVQEAVTARCLKDWTSTRLPDHCLRRLLNEEWRPFLIVTEQGADPRYRFYHRTLREFFEGNVERNNLLTSEKAFLAELSQATQAANTSLVDCYLSWWGGIDHGLPRLSVSLERDSAQGYGLRHLVSHLESCGRYGDLHALLGAQSSTCQNAWYAAKEAVGDISGYLSEVARAWDLAETGYSEVSSKSQAELVALQCRYALIITSLKSLAKSIPPILLRALVENGLWTVTQALTYARAVPHPWRRAEALGFLADYAPDHGQILEEALREAGRIDLEEWRATVIAQLAPDLTPAQLQGALKMTRALESSWQRAKALGRLVGCLPDLEKKAVLDEAMAASQGIGDAYRRADALSAIAQNLPKASQGLAVEEILAVSRGITHRYRRIEVLTGAIPLLQGSKREEVCTQVLNSIREIKNQYQRTKAIVALVSTCPEWLQQPILREALESVHAIEDHFWRGFALIELAPYLTGTLLYEALDLAKRMDGNNRARALAGLAPHIPEPAGSKLLQGALAVAQRIGDDRSREFLLQVMDVCLSELMGREASAKANEIVDTSQTEQVIRLLADVGSLLSDATRTKILRQCLIAIGEDCAEFRQVESLVLLAPYLTTRLSQEAISIAQELSTEYERSRALTSLLPRLEGDQSCEVAAGVRISAQDIRDPYWRAVTVAELLPHLPRQDQQNALQEVLTVAGAIREEYWRSRALASLVAALATAARLEEAQEVAAAIQDGYWAEAATARTVPCLAEKGYLRKALVSAQNLAHEQWKAVAFANLVPHLLRPHLQEVMESVQHMSDRYWQENVLAEIAIRIAELGDVDRGLASAQSIGATSQRKKALAGLVPYLVKLPRATLYPLWCRALRRLARRPRSALLDDLAVLAPVIIYLGGDESAMRIRDATEVITQWWP